MLSAENLAPSQKEAAKYGEEWELGQWGQGSLQTGALKTGERQQGGYGAMD